MNTNPFEDGLTRYLTRQQILALGKIKVGIGGAGGLGSNVALLLTRSGIKHFEILDHDVVCASDLNRQGFFIDEIGAKKTATLEKRLKAVNPDVRVTSQFATWKKEDAEKYFNDCDLIVEAFDVASLKRDFVEAYHDKTPLLVSGNGMAGYARDELFFTRRLNNMIFVGDQKTDIADGLPPLAPRVTRCAAMMAEIIVDEILKKITNA